MLFFAFVLSAHLQSTWARNFLVADFFEPDGECDSDLLQYSIIQEVGAGCIDRPRARLPDGTVSDMQSYEIMSCENGANQLEVMFKVYSGKECTGKGYMIPSPPQLSSTNCYSKRMRFSCQSEPVSLVELWPAVDIYFNSATCQESISTRPGCITIARSMFGWSCNDEKNVMSHEIYETPMMCADGVPSDSYPIPTDVCLSNNFSQPEHIDKNFSEALNNDLFLLIKDPSLAELSHNYYFEGFYSARCTGY
jgi:hypothetical protein